MISIENNQLKVDIDEKGAQITHAIDKINNFDFIWNGNEWLEHAPIIFPAVGRLNEDKYHLNGKYYNMKENGFAGDYPWTVVDKGDDRVSLTLTENDETLKCYPFEFSLMVTYSLVGNQVQVRFLITNHSAQDMSYALGILPGFNLPIDGDQLKFEDYQIELLPKVQQLTSLELSSSGLRTGKAVPVAVNKNGNLDLSYKKFENGSVLLENLGLTSVRIFSEKSNHQITIDLGEFKYLSLGTKAEKMANFISIGLLTSLPAQKNQNSEKLDANEQKTYTATITLD